MPQLIFFTEMAKAQLRRIDRIVAMRILLALTRLAESGDGDIKTLEGFDPPQMRLRVGDYRIRFFRVDGTFHVLAVSHRSDAYR
jgi:mRNA interferase RelE/StbE